MNDPGFIVSLILVFLLAGTVKGVIGLGLPTVSLALLTVISDLKVAMALLLVPSAITNFWQAIQGPDTRAVVCRIWPFLAAATIAIFFGAMALNLVNLPLLSALLGLLLVIYAVSSLAGVRIPPALGRHRGFAVGMGMTNGLLTGMTGSFVVPGVMYLQSLELPKDLLIKAMGMLFLLSTVALGLALGRYDLLSSGTLMLSSAAVLPAIAGMWLGKLVRDRLSEVTFRRTFYLALLVLGLYIAVNATIT